MPVLNINMDQVANKKIKGARPHMIYQNTFYKGLDVSRLENQHEGSRTTMRSILTGVAALLGAAGLSSAAEAQTLKMMKSLDAPHYDGQRTTWSPTSDIVNMFQDTLVALDWDGKTAIPYLAKSWTDQRRTARLYTFKLRDDVTFCSGKKFTAADVVYSFKRLKDPETKAPYAWRAGNIKELRAPDPYTVEYELERAVLRAAAAAHHVHQRDPQQGERGGARQGLRHQGDRRHRAVVLRELAAAHRDRAEAPRRLQMGPVDVPEQGPGEVREAQSIKIVPEDSSRVAAMLGGQFDVTHQFPLQFIQQVKAAPILHRPGGQAQLPADVLRLQDHAADGLRHARARGDEHRHQPRRDRQGHHARQRRPGLHLRRSRRRSTSPPTTKGMIKEDVERAKKLLDEAGWKVGADGIREKDGVKLAPKVLFTQVAYFPRVSEAIQGYMRKIGVDWKIVRLRLDHRARPKMAKQDYELWTVTVPYLSAGELLNFYFNSKNIPTPNRMNWKDPETDEWLRPAAPR